MTRTRLLALPVLLGVLACGASPAATQQAAPKKAPAAAPAKAPAKAAPAPFDSARAWEHLRQMVAIGPRPAGSAGIKQTRAYITKQLAGYGLTVQEQTFTATTPRGRIEMSNLIVKLPGQRPDRILLTGHYDTKPIAGINFVGASDGASSAAILIELARVLKTRSNELTYEFVWFDGEEAFCFEWSECGTPTAPDNTYGSRYYVQAAKTSNTLSSIKAMILFDMIGAKNLKLKRDGSSTPWLVDIFWAAAKRLGQTAVFEEVHGDVGGDDHMPFMQAGVPSIDLIDLDDYSQFWHTAQDDLAHVSAGSLQSVGDVTLAALPDVVRRVSR